ncbi:hypothetical protein Aconfl_25960 [Algoriphagus confluentis]|uniref:Uncharacterized protein n=1 Tax=Algoriphagus confluentis TaxID=1697556 RepID=A0ABQ6PPP6_9BACT|nr:hypothetical protein Aconfl_25960 [Algoriphagus confluentis]
MTKGVLSLQRNLYRLDVFPNLVLENTDSKMVKAVRIEFLAAFLVSKFNLTRFIVFLLLKDLELWIENFSKVWNFGKVKDWEILWVLYLASCV